jgi:hypothetical protein
MAQLDDPRRLDTIRDHLTNTTPDEVLDECVREAARRAGTPTATVSIIMGHIQYFRASVGLPADLELSRATSRSCSFCQFVVVDEAPLVIPAAASDARIPQELVERYGIKAYAGVPVWDGGQVVGTLCVIDTKPRPFDAATIKAIEGVAARVSRRLEVLRRRQDNEEASAVEMVVLASRVNELLKSAQAVEGSLRGISSMLGSIEGLRAAVKRASAPPSDEGDVTAQYAGLEGEVRNLRTGALRVAAGAELQHVPVEREVVDALRTQARSLDRSLHELGPLVRLVRGLLSAVIDAKTFERNASVLGQAMAAGERAITALKDLQEAGSTIADRIRLLASDKN